MNPYQLFGVGGAILAIIAGAWRYPLKGVGGLYLAGSSLVIAITAAIDLLQRGYGGGQAAVGGAKIFAAVFVIFAFWYFVGLLINWVWRKATS